MNGIVSYPGSARASRAVSGAPAGNTLLQTIPLAGARDARATQSA